MGMGLWWGGGGGKAGRTQENQLSLQTQCVLRKCEVSTMLNSLARASTAPVQFCLLLSWKTFLHSVFQWSCKGLPAICGSPSSPAGLPMCVSERLLSVVIAKKQHRKCKADNKSCHMQVTILKEQLAAEAVRRKFTKAKWFHSTCLGICSLWPLKYFFQYFFGIILITKMKSHNEST